MTDAPDKHEEHHWPDVPRLGFGTGPRRQFDAQLKWALSDEHSPFGYKEGYRRAALGLVRQVVEDRLSPDLAIFPLAFLWRHHVELALKDIIVDGRALAEESFRSPAHHRLLDLWKEARPYVEDCGDPHAPELANVEVNIREFEKIDPRADGFRYPRARDGIQPSLSDAPDAVNLERLNEAMLAVSNFLDAVQTVQSVRLDSRSEALAEMRDYY
jgi:hypothetical protein